MIRPGIKLSEHSLEIKGRPGILYGGEFQYFRIPAQLWEPSLVQLARAKVNFISCYIPWIWHEAAENSFDFQGLSSPERNLRRFLHLVEAQEMALIVRPGPYVYGEYQGFGIPEWLRQKYPEILMMQENQSRGREVALNHPVYKQKVSLWLESTFAFLKPWIKRKRIIACQIDNETGLPQFGGVANASDFNPHTIGCWQDFLRNRYGQVQHLNHVWHSSYAAFGDIAPPARPQGNVIQIRHWAEFIESYLVEHLDWLMGLFRQHLPETFLFLNDPCLCQWPNHSPKKAQLATIGYDIYSKFTTDRASTHDIPFSLSFAPEFFASINQTVDPKRLLMGVEIGSGWFDPRVQVRKEATLQKSMLALLRGVRVLDYYLLHDCVESDGVPWIFQSPLDREGQCIDRYETVAAIGRFAQNHGHLLAESEPLHNAIGVLKYMPQSWDYLRSNYTLWTALDLLDSALVHFSGLTGVYGSLLEAGFNPIVHDLETIPFELLRQLKVVFFASTGVMHRDVYQKLQYYVELGGTLISFGLPVSHDHVQEHYERNPLFPARPAGQPHRLQFGNNSVLSSIALDMVDYQMLRGSHPHRLSLHTLDMMHPFVELAKHVGRTGTWLDTDKGQRFWASRFISFWQGGGITPLLLHPNQGVVGYTRSLGRGRIVFLGTLPGLFFDTPAYYGIEPDKKQSVLGLLRHLLSERGLWPLVDPIPNTEVILRALPDKRLLAGLVNRGPAIDLELVINYPSAYREVRELFTSDATNDRLEKGRFQHLRGHLGKDSVYVALLS
ncbi:MAG TPA: beta-galactosidase [Candidatus Obscuribacterales bacterium]